MLNGRNPANKHRTVPVRRFMKKRVLIACNIFEEEIAFLLKKEQESLKVEIIWVDAGLHSNLAVLENELSSAINYAKNLDHTGIRVLFGQGCLPQIDFLCEEKGVSISSVKNCLSAFLGDEKVKELEKNNTMLMTPSWVRVWPENMKRISGWNEVDFRMNLGRYERILVLDAGINSLTDDDVLGFFDLVQVSVDFETISLNHFHDILHSLLE